MSIYGFSTWTSLFGGGPIRVTTYEFASSNSFTGTTYELTLLNTLTADYFVLISGHYSVHGNGTDASYVQVYEDPFGTGDLGTSSGGTKLGLRRDATGGNEWEGTVTVVESQNPGADAFQLVDVLIPQFAAAPGASPQDITDTSTAWSDINQVAIFGGHRGGGVRLQGPGGNEYTEAYCRIWPSSTATVNLRRRAQAGLANFSALDVTCYVVEWGANWTVQRVNVTGNNAGAGVNATGEYNTAAINSAVRNNTWVWASGTIDASGTGGNVDGEPGASVVTLGDGVNQNASETTVAAGTEVDQGGVGHDAEVYVMEHTDLVVDYRFHADADDSDPHALTVDGTSGSESYDEVSNPRTTEGNRLGLVYGSADPTGADWWKVIHHQRHTADTTLTIGREGTGYAWAGWVQSVDFTDVAA